MQQLKYILFALTSSIILWNCASIQRPIGGEKDRQAPRSTYTYPEQEQTRIHPEFIQVDFDEFITLKNLQDQLLVSPPLNQKPSIIQKGKSIRIDLHEKLQENTTYTFNFGNSIADFNEGNVLQNFTLVFSTGEQLDSLSQKGIVYSTPSKELPKNVLVGLYRIDALSSNDSSYLQKPNYFDLVKEDGSFNIKHIQEGTYEIIAFEDLNANYRYDSPLEQIAFKNTFINAADSSANELWLFKEEEKLKLLEAYDKGRLHWAFNKEVKEVTLKSQNELNFKHQIKKDSVLVWPQRSQKDSSFFYLQTGELMDTLPLNPNKLNPTLKPTATLRDHHLRKNQEIEIYFSEPIHKVDTSKIILLKDSLPTEYHMHYDDFMMTLRVPYQGKNTYTLVLHKGALTSTYTIQNDSLAINFYSKDASALASLSINLLHEVDDYLIQLLKNNQVVHQINQQQPLILTEILPDTYQLRIIIDENKDGMWTPGNYQDKRQPEKVYYHKGDVKLRANWELEVDL